MAKLVFDGHTHQLSLVTDAGQVTGTWAAYNNVDSHATLTHVENRVYNIQDRTAPHQHSANPNGPYGSHGIVRFNVASHPGIGVHSGRANARNAPGPAHATMGCIRTSDEAMAAIAGAMATSPLSTIEVRNNSAPVARAASVRHQHVALRGRHAR